MHREHVKVACFISPLHTLMPSLLLPLLPPHPLIVAKQMDDGFSLENAVFCHVFSPHVQCHDSLLACCGVCSFFSLSKHQIWKEVVYK